MPAPSKASALHLTPIQELIFLDRYALKDPSRSFEVGDVVVALTNPDARYPERAVGIVERVEKDKVAVKLKETGEIVELEKKYVDRPVEAHPLQMWQRMAKAAATVEEKQDQADVEKDFRWLLDNFRFVPGGRINAMLGTDQNLTAYNCFVIPMAADDPSVGRDSRRAIMDTLRNMVEIMSRGGGVGINLSTLRPKLSYVKGVNGKSSGAVSWGALFSFATGLVEQGGCLYELSSVLTDKGLMSAKELYSRLHFGEQIRAWTHEGWKPFTDLFDNGTKEAFEIHTDRGYILRVTSDHKILTFNQDGQLRLKPLRELSEGDTICLLLGEGTDAEPIALDTEVPKGSPRSTRIKATSLPAVLDEDLAYFVGYFTGNGSILHTDSPYQLGEGIRLTVPTVCPKDMERLVDISKKLFPGIQPHIYEGSGECQVLELRSVVVQDFLDQNGLLKKRSSDARVPDLIKRSGRTVVEAFLAGYLAADGSGSLVPYASTASLVLARDIQELALSVGLPSRLDEKANGKGNVWYTISFPGHAAQQRLLEIVEGRAQRFDGFEPPAQERAWVWPANLSKRYPEISKMRMMNQNATNTSTRVVTRAAQVVADLDLEILSKCLPVTITSIETMGEHQTYDFTVQDTHMFWVDGLYVSNSRRGALMLILNDWHPDLLEFITAKRDMGAITNANISVGISDAFMQAVKDDKMWDLIFPDMSDPDYDRLWDGDIKYWRDELKKPVKVYKTVRAREIWNTIIKSAWMSAEPGVVFIERMNAYSNSWYFNKLIATNPCAEQSLPAWGVCNLGHINLSRFTKDGDVDWISLRRAIHLGVRFLDNVIDYTRYFFEENERVQKTERRVGMGTMGLGEMLIRLGLRYGSPESIDFINRLYRFIATEAYRASAFLAKKKGPFPAFDAHKFLQSGFMKSMPDDVRQEVAMCGIRNVCLLTQAPTGTTGTMVGTSTGIEPYYSWTYWRKGRLGMHEMREAIVDEWFDQNPDVERDLKNLPDYFVTAMDLSPEDHVRVQAAVQRWTDASISKTANCPNNYTIEETRLLYEKAYDLGCKGVTIYRDGSRDQQVLMQKKEDEVKEEAASLPKREEKPMPKAQQDQWSGRPQVLKGATYEWPTPLGKAFVTINDLDGKPVEVFVNIGKAGTDVTAMSEALGRLVTLYLKHANGPFSDRKIPNLVNHLSDIGGSMSVGFGKNRVMSVPDAIAKSLEQHSQSPKEQVLEEPASMDAVFPAQTASFDLCPNCGQAGLVREEGCLTCRMCGSSRC